MQTETMPSMETLMERQKLVGWVVRDAILDSGDSYSEVMRQWPIAPATLNRLMNSGNVGIRFYRKAEIKLNLPRGLFERIIDGDIEAIRSMPDLDEQLREFIVRELGGVTPVRRARRKA